MHSGILSYSILQSQKYVLFWSLLNMIRCTKKSYNICTEEKLFCFNFKVLFEFNNCHKSILKLMMDLFHLKSGEQSKYSATIVEKWACCAITWKQNNIQNHSIFRVKHYIQSWYFIIKYKSWFLAFAIEILMKCRNCIYVKIKYAICFSVFQNIRPEIKAAN